MLPKNRRAINCATPRDDLYEILKKLYQRRTIILNIDAYYYTRIKKSCQPAKKLYLTIVFCRKKEYNTDTVGKKGLLRAYPMQLFFKDRLLLCLQPVSSYSGACRIAEGSVHIAREVC